MPKLSIVTLASCAWCGTPSIPSFQRRKTRPSEVKQVAGYGEKQGGEVTPARWAKNRHWPELRGAQTVSQDGHGPLLSISWALVRLPNPKC